MRAAYSTGDLARATGHTLRTIRHYEAAGLLAPSEVSDGGHRRYTEDDLERLRLIIDLRELGLALCEIKSILELRAGCHTAAEFAARFRQVIEVHLEAAQRRLERLRRMRREILASLTLVEAKLAGAGASKCPCAVAVHDAAPRIVKVLARQAGCGCGEVEAAHHAALPVPGPGSGGEAGGGTEPIGFA